MSKPFPYWLRLSIVSSLSVLLSFNPAFAGRVIHRAICGSCYRAPAEATWSNGGCAPAPIASSSCGCDIASSAAVASNCGGCGSMETFAIAEAISVPECGCGAASSMPSAMEHSPSVQPVPSVIPDTIHSHSDSSSAPMVSPKQSIDAADAAPPKPQAAPPKPKDEPKVEPKQDAPKPPADDLFSPPSTPAPSSPPKDDLFSSPPANEPAMKPADDLFSTPPSNEPTTQPAAPPAEDLFAPPPSTKPNAAPADDIFGNPPPATTPPANPLDDLFGTPSTDKAPSATPGASDLDNLFKSTQSEPNGEMPMEATKPVSTDVESDPNFDNLFANPGSTSTLESARPERVQEPSADSNSKKPDASFDDLFKSTSAPVEKTIAPEELAFRGAEFREWVDNTGDYSVKARLVVIYPDRVRLVKENGKFTAVPMSRLCNADRDYVNWVAVSLGKGASAKFVNTDSDPASRIQDIAR